jgi:UDP-N-acetylmuramoyl-L-alanyl-D-glutamate--2,6-diaminopimelate ligase
VINLNLIDKKLPKDIIISGIQNHSKKVKKGDLFVAIKGSKENGINFIKEAISHGAVAVLTSDKTLNISNYSIPIIKVSNPRKKLSEISKLLFPNSPKVICGVTGTNGKSSTIDFLYQIWCLLGFNAASIGTLGVKSKDFNFKTKNTTPDSIELHKMINDLSLSGVSHLALEVSSHAIDQNRIDSVNFESVCFTNLSLEHLDYHKNLENYSNIKFKLFDKILKPNKTSVICIQDKQGANFLKNLKALNKKVIDVGEGAEYLNLISIKKSAKGSEVGIIYLEKCYSFIFEFKASFQIINLLCAAGLAITSGCDHQKVFSVLEKIKPVEGRFELINLNNNLNIIIDYAHTPEALSCVLENIKKEYLKKIVLIFGCGGDRDKSKRFLMGKVAEKYCDEIIITNDNPRNEDPSSIASQILKGCSGAEIILDRVEAIKSGLSKINDNDVLLIAGKGHEEFQIIGDDKIPFSDRETVENFFEASHE